ncbi:MAG: enterochelin esterase [Propionicimonas sp.]|nr:enterochelin esterase [Propionicimonas sp.]
MTQARRIPPKPPRPRPAPLASSPIITALENNVARAGGAGKPRGAALVQNFWATNGANSPLVEELPNRDERLVTFLWQDADAERVLVFVNRLTDERNLAASYARRVPGTDLWHLTYRMAADWRASYSFLPQYDVRPPWLDGDDQAEIRAALDRGLADPRNAETCRNRRGTVMSVVSLPAAPAQHQVAYRTGVVRGTVTEHSGPGERRLWVYSPPQAAAEPTPVVLVLDGEVWTSSQDLPTTMDNLIADRLVRPAHLVMLDSGGRTARWGEMGGPGEIGHYLIRRLLPWARRHYPISPRRGDVVVAGLSLGGLVALRTALENSFQVGGVLSQSASLWQDDLTAALAASDIRGLRAYLEVGSQEWLLAQPNRQFAERLARAGAEVQFVEYNGGHDYACWRGGVADGLRYLLPVSRQPGTG